MHMLQHKVIQMHCHIDTSMCVCCMCACVHREFLRVTSPVPGGFACTRLECLRNQSAGLLAVFHMATGGFAFLSEFKEDHNARAYLGGGFLGF